MLGKLLRPVNAAGPDCTFGIPARAKNAKTIADARAQNHTTNLMCMAGFLVVIWETRSSA